MRGGVPPSRVSVTRYSTFFWPLALNSVAMQLESQFQNGVLARFPDGTSELATFALASSSFQLVNAFLIFVPQTVTVLAASRQSRAACLRYLLAVSIALTLPLAGLAFLPAGTALLARLLGMPAEVLPSVGRYLRWMTPLIGVNALRQYCTGLLIRNERTRAVTALNVVHLGALLLVLFAGRAWQWTAIGTLAGATVFSNLLHLVLIAWISLGMRPPRTGVRADRPGPPLTFPAFLRFFWPVAFTSGMFALSRPITYAFINRTVSAVAVVAALRLAFDLAIFFQNPVNQLRHLYTTYGEADPQGVRRFSLRVSLWLTLAMASIAFSPLGGFVFENVLGGTPEVGARAMGALRVMCLGPLVLTVRNLQHGHMMVTRRTGGMAAGAALRVLTIFAGSALLHHLGRLDHRGAAMLMVCGFAAEAAVARYAVCRVAAGEAGSGGAA